MFGTHRLALEHDRLIRPPRASTLAQTERWWFRPLHANTGVNGYLYLPHGAPV